MPRNGSDVYSLPAGSTVVNGDTSDASDINTPLADIASDLNTPRPIVAGGTGASSASAARTALGLAIGTNVQAYSADLAAYAASPLSANELAQLQNINSASISETQWGYLGTMTAAGAALIDDASASAQRTTLGLGTAATLNVGTSANSVVQLNGSAELPAVSGANLTDLPGFTSSAQTITAGGLLTLAHGLGAVPRHVTMWIVCTDAGGDAGYAQNDRVAVAVVSSSSALNRYNSIYADATNINIRFDPSSGVFIVGNKSTGTATIITDSKWQLIVEATR